MKKVCIILLALTVCVSLFSCSEDAQIQKDAPTANTSENDLQEASADDISVDEVSAEETYEEELHDHHETEALISAIGRVSSNSGEAVAVARASYDNLDESGKKLVSNYDTLLWAEHSYDFISKEAANGIENLLRITGFEAKRGAYSVNDTVTINLGYRNLNEKTIDTLHIYIQAYDANGQVVKSGIYDKIYLKDDDILQKYGYSYISPYKASFSSFHERKLADNVWIRYFPTTAIDFKIIEIAIDYCDGTEIELTSEEVAKVIY